MAEPLARNREATPLPVGYGLGEYEIQAVLGCGGFGITYRARDTKLGALVAIKEYFPQLFATRTESFTIIPNHGGDLDTYQWGLAEFLREAQALAKFKHPHIVRVLRFLETNGTAYTAMEYEEGETLASHLAKRGGFLDEPDLLRIFLPILSGLQAVHEAGLLHLDIKPDNIYLRANGQPMLIDFGSSRQMRSDGMTAQKVTLTQGYCALEQYPGKGEVGPWSDVFGMGATLYRCLTGKQPVDALQRQQTFAKSRIDPHRPAATIERPFFSPHLRACVDRALALDPKKRPPSAFALQQGLMGKDMEQAAKPKKDFVFRLGSGYLGVIPKWSPMKKWRRRYSGFEKFVVMLVFLVTALVITPKIMIDTGHLSEEEFFNAIDNTKNDLVARVKQTEEEINEKVFGKKPIPKTTTTRATLREPVAPATTELPAVPAPKPFATDMQHVTDITLTEGSLRAIGLLKHGAVLATVTQNGRVQLWDTQTGERRKELPLAVRTPQALGIFPNSRWFAATGADNVIGIHDPVGNLEQILRTDSPHAVLAIAASPDGAHLAEVAEDGKISVWELTRFKRTHVFTLPQGQPLALAFSPNNQTLAVADALGGVTLIDAKSGKVEARQRVHEAAVSGLGFSPDGRFIASTGGDVRLWTAGAAFDGTRVLTKNTGAHGVAFSPDGQWVLGLNEAGAAEVWSTSGTDRATPLPAPERRYQFVALGPDGKWVAAAGETGVRLWRLKATAP